MLVCISRLVCGNYDKIVYILINKNYCFGFLFFFENSLKLGLDINSI